MADEDDVTTLDVGSLLLGDIADVRLDTSKRIVVFIPVAAIGYVNQHVDICSDLIDVCFVAERLAATAARVTCERDYDRETHRTFVRLGLEGPGPGLRAALRDAVLLLGDEYEDEEHELAIQALRDEIGKFEESLDRRVFRVPNLIDWFHANLVGGAYHEMRSEAPDHYRSEIERHPERGVGFFRSGYSSALGAPVYASSGGWIVPTNIDLDTFLIRTGQRYRVANLRPGRVVTVDGETWGLADGMAVHVDADAYFRSKICASIDRARQDDGAFVVEEHFRWSPPAPWRWDDQRTAPIASGLATPAGAGPERCLVDASGTLVVFSDGWFHHLFFETSPLNPPAITRLLEQVGTVGAGLAAGGRLECDWTGLTDETFERLCYDLIREHPRFDADTIRKFGKSRSRDGGRDIQVHEVGRPGGQGPRRWIFQCKLITNGASLTGARLTDVGDMIDSYGAEGFGVLTSGPIDATLYDKLDAVCARRKVEQLNMSVLELERALVAHPTIRARYFPSA